MKPFVNYHRNWLIWLLALLVVVILLSRPAKAEEMYRITAYCACEKCCGKWSDGYFASGRKVYVGGVACNWLPFGTKLEIEGLGTYTVEDRGAKSIFGTKDNPIKALDIYFDQHKEARKFGVQYRKVTIK
jgi:3D (Asp-Asp-Asp) domain-containing protein